MIFENIVFIHIPRTGGTSIEHAFGKTIGNRTKHLSAKEIKKQVGLAQWQRSFVFTFIRNPWDRLISLYHQPYFQNQPQFKNKGLEFFITNYKPAPWEKKFYFEYLNDDGIDFIGRFENREEGIKVLNKISNINIDPTIHERQGNRVSNYRDYYNETTKMMVYELFKEDIEQYNYTF